MGVVLVPLSEAPVVRVRRVDALAETGREPAWGVHVRLLAAWTGTRRHVRVRQHAVFAHAAGFAQRRVGTACSANLRSSAVETRAN